MIHMIQELFGQTLSVLGAGPNFPNQMSRHFPPAILDVFGPHVADFSGR
jgi:hypothetical protein